MSNVTNPTLFRALDELINAQNRHIKWASDGFNSSMPEDENDHLTEPSEGSHISEMDSDLKNADSGISNVEDTEDASYSEDGQKDQSLSSQDVSEADEGERDYEFGHDDPGTTMPASADNDKYASYDFATNFAAFNKLASAFECGIDHNEQNNAEQNQQKQAGYDDSDELIGKVAYTIDLANENAEIFSKLASYSFNKLASGEDVTPNDVDTVLDVAEDNAPTSAPVDDQTLVDELAGADDAETQAAIEALAQAVDAGKVSPEELDALLGQPETAEEAEKAASYKKYAAYTYNLNNANRILNLLPAEDARALAGLPFTKIAELADAIDEDDSELSPEDQALLESMSDEELQTLIDIADGLESGALSPEEVEALANGGDAGATEEEISPEESADDMSDDEALNELSSAMVEQGVGPDDLENAEDVPEEKQAMVHKLASAVRGFRNSGKFQYKQAKAGTKQAQARSLFHQFLNEFLNR